MKNDERKKVKAAAPQKPLDALECGDPTKQSSKSSLSPPCSELEPYCKVCAVRVSCSLQYPRAMQWMINNRLEKSRAAELTCWDVCHTQFFSLGIVIPYSTTQANLQTCSGRRQRVSFRVGQVTGEKNQTRLLTLGLTYSGTGGTACMYQYLDTMLHQFLTVGTLYPRPSALV